MGNSLQFICDEIIKIANDIGLNVVGEEVNEVTKLMSIYIRCNDNVKIYIKKIKGENLQCVVDIYDNPYEIPPFSIPFYYNIKEYKSGDICSLSSSGGVYGFEGKIDDLIVKMRDLGLE